MPNLIIAGCLLFAASVATAVSARAQTPRELPTIVVTPQGQPLDYAQASPSLSYLGDADLALVNAIHPSELRVGAPGLWVSRGNGQEHLMALRSPVLTGAGSCGAFLYLHNGIPLRPASFCNVNQLIELNLEQADALEILRGPGPVLYGSNALHGVMHARSEARAARALRLDAGPDDYFRVALDAGTEHSGRALRARLVAAHDGGYRADSGYGMGKFSLDGVMDVGASRVHAAFAATLLNQETAGFILGQDAYRDDAQARTNPNPEAYRDADSQRLNLRIEQPDGTVWLPYLRRSAMTFLQHFLPGQPTEFNGQRSAGLKVFRNALRPGGAVHYGADAELAHIWLREVQALPVQSNSAFLVATRPVGTHYDFRVDAVNAAMFYERRFDLGNETQVSAGARLEYTGLDYQTARMPGRGDDQGNACGFGGCLFNRPADRRDHFVSLAPKLAWNRTLNPHWRAFASLARGFRAPQVTELYRLQNTQSVADLDTEDADSLDLGLRGGGTSWQLDATVFAMNKRNVIIRDADGLNVNGGRTSHRGVELDVRLEPAARVELAASVTLARHRYAFSRDSSGTERIRDGDDIDTAPRTLGSARITWHATNTLRALLEWEHMGGYYLDAANEHRYGGHNLLHAGIQWTAGDLTLGVRMRNVLDEGYAERADYAFGNYRYFPGKPRTLLVSLGWQPRR